MELGRIRRHPRIELTLHGACRYFCNSHQKHDKKDEQLICQTTQKTAIFCKGSPILKTAAPLCCTSFWFCMNNTKLSKFRKSKFSSAHLDYMETLDYHYIPSHVTYGTWEAQNDKTSKFTRDIISLAEAVLAWKKTTNGKKTKRIMAWCQNPFTFQLLERKTEVTSFGVVSLWCTLVFLTSLSVHVGIGVDYILEWIWTVKETKSDISSSSEWN